MDVEIPIKINKIPFVPLYPQGSPEYNSLYKYDYIKAAELINSGEYTAEQVCRQFILNDLWFIVYFCMGIETANHPFVIKMCRVVEEGPQTKTLDIWSRAHFKAIDVNEKVPTPNGWKKHGDLVPGDFVFGSSGTPTKIMAKTKVFTDAECFRVTFDKSHSVVVSGEHLWTVNIHSKKRMKGTKTREGRKIHTIDTRQLMTECNHSSLVKTRIRPTINKCSPLEYPVKDLIVDPYVLGYWLGDGNSNAPIITIALDDMTEVMGSFISANHTCTERKTFGNSTSFIVDKKDTRFCLRGHDRTKVGVYRNSCMECRRLDVLHKKDRSKKPKPVANSLSWRLRKLSLLKGNGKQNSNNIKHIPEIYKQASISQRIALLQGLMDSDGTCDSRGTATFSNINKKLIDDFFELAAGLGLKPGKGKRLTTVNDSPYTFWQVTFQVHSDNFPVFRLCRKQERSVKKRITYQALTHAIVSVEKVKSMPCSCIQVDAEDGQYLIGEHFIPTHNSSLITIAETVQYHLKNPDHCTCIFSFKKPAAEKFLDGVRRVYEKEIMIACFPDILYESPEGQSPSWSLQNGITLKRPNSARREKTVEASGLVEGMAKGSHFERRIYDDVETADMGDSPDVMDTCYSRFEMSAYLGTGTDSDIERVIGTFYNHAGPLVRIKEKQNIDGSLVYKTRIVPATVDGTVDGAPVLLSQKKLDEEKVKSHFYSQMLCDPTPRGAQKLDSSLIREIGPEFIPKNILKFMVIDPAGGAKDGRGDSWAILVVGIEPKTDDIGASNIYITMAIFTPLTDTAAIEETVT